MKLIEVSTNLVCVPPTGTLYHCTLMHSAAAIIKSGYFKLARIPRNQKGFQNRTRPYVMSTTPHLSSDFIDMMFGPGSAILTINANAFAKNGPKMVPYVCPDAQDELGPNFDEKEIQFRYHAPTLPIPKPINQCITHIFVGTGKTDPTGAAHYNTQQLEQFVALCKQMQIPVELANDWNFRDS